MPRAQITAWRPRTRTRAPSRTTRQNSSWSLWLFAPAVAATSAAVEKVKSAVGTAFSWLADDSMYYLAVYVKEPISESIYAELDERMTGAPKNLMVAYEQAVYFLAIGVRRAYALNEARAAEYLTSRLEQVAKDASEVSDKVSSICDWTGFACPKGGTADVLTSAIDALESSGLSEQDRLIDELKANRWSFQLRRAVPFVIALGVSAGIGTWVYQRRKRRRAEG